MWGNASNKYLTKKNKVSRLKNFIKRYISLEYKNDYFIECLPRTCQWRWEIDSNRSQEDHQVGPSSWTEDHSLLGSYDEMGNHRIKYVFLSIFKLAKLTDLFRVWFLPVPRIWPDQLKSSPRIRQCLCWQRASSGHATPWSLRQRTIRCFWWMPFWPLWLVFKWQEFICKL